MMTNTEIFLIALNILQLLFWQSIVFFRERRVAIQQTTPSALPEKNEHDVQIVSELVKKYEILTHNKVKKLTEEAASALQSSLFTTTDDLKKEFAQQLSTILNTWSVEKKHSIEEALEKNILEVSRDSAALVAKVTQTSLKRKLNLEDHHQLAQEAISSILMKVEA